MLGKILLCPVLFINIVFGSDLGPNPVMVIFSYLKSFKFSNDKINAVLGLKDYQRKYIIDLLLKNQKGGEVIIDN